MHLPCTCPECTPGPGVDYGRDRAARVLAMMEDDRADRIRRQQQLRERLYRDT
jgi:hypothetical protein